MNDNHQFSRRDFLKVLGITAAAGSIGACISISLPSNDSFKPTEREITVIELATPTTPPTATEKPVIEPLYPEMVLVEPGSFQMGSTEGHDHEQPIHQVTLTIPFYIAIYAVTYDEFDQYREDIQKAYVNVNQQDQGLHPVSAVDWYDVVAYCNWLSEKAGFTPCYSSGGKATKCDFTANGYRLPTEAEWEYAARGGQKSRGYLYAGSNDPDEVGWYADNSDGKAHPVGEKTPNELGIYDMSGNRWEWCWDWYEREFYSISPEINPTGPPKVPSGTFAAQRVRRSGSAKESIDSMRIAYRSFDSANYPGDNGFRLVKTA
jgi:sulfatase modifying factor 1